MNIDLTDTSTGAIHEAFTQARRRMGGPTSGMVLTLIIVTDEAAQYDAVRAANQAGREHPSRVLAVIARKPKAESRLDAEIRVGETGPGVTILLRMYGPLGQHADSVVAPLLAPDVPVVTWWPDEAPPSPSADPLGAVAQRRVTDAAASEAPRETVPRRGPGRAGQPECGPDRGLARAAARHRGPARRVRRPGNHRGEFRDGGREGRAVPAGRPERHPVLAGASGTPGRAAPAGGRRPDRRGAAQARAGRGLRGNPARAGRRHRSARLMSEPKRRGAVWTEERRRSDEGRRRLKSASAASEGKQ